VLHEFTKLPWLSDKSTSRYEKMPCLRAGRGKVAHGFRKDNFASTDAAIGQSDKVLTLFMSLCVTSQDFSLHF
jgi:hypothetical protein